MTGAVKALVLEATFEQLADASGSTFFITPFREWTVSRGALFLERSVVAVGVPKHLIEQQIMDELVEKTA